MSGYEKKATTDVLWKVLIKKFFREFLGFYKPDLYPAVVFERTEFLDKELLSITGKSHKGIVDVLAKLHLKNGDVEFILFHVEVQGYREEDFPSRMFGYFARIWDRFRKPVTSLAILTPGVGVKKVGNVYSLDSYGTTLHYEYSLFDTRQLRYHNCVASENPVEVAAAILAETRDVPKWKRKYEVIRRLIHLGLTHEEIHLLVSYVDRHLPLEGEDLKKFESRTANDTREVKMIMTSFEEKGIEKGVEKTARRMLSLGVDLQEVERLTGLSKHRIELLKRERGDSLGSKMTRRRRAPQARMKPRSSENRG